MLCSALINSGLEYCSSAWYPGLLKEFKDDLDTMQRKMVRFVRGMGPREHVGDGEIRSTGWLPFPRRVDYFKAMHVFRVKNLMAPSYLCQNFQLVSSVLSYSLRGSDVNFSLRACPFPPNTFTRSAIALWNSLPLDLKLIRSLNIFRRSLASFMKKL